MEDSRAPSRRSLTTEAHEAAETPPHNAVTMPAARSTEEVGGGVAMVHSTQGRVCSRWRCECDCEGSISASSAAGGLTVKLCRTATAEMRYARYGTYGTVRRRQVDDLRLRRHLSAAFIGAPSSRLRDLWFDPCPTA